METGGGTNKFLEFLVLHWLLQYFGMLKASTPTQNITGPVGPVTQDLLVLQNFYWSYKFFFNITRKNIA